LTIISSFQPMRPRFAAKLVLTPIRAPQQKHDMQDVFLMDPGLNPHCHEGMGLVFPGAQISAAQRAATWVSLPDQEEIEKGQIFYLQPEREADDDADASNAPVAHFLSGRDLMDHVRKQRLTLLQQFTTEYDAAVKAQESGKWEGARYLYDQITSKYKASVASVEKKDSEPTTIFIPATTFANVHFQLAKTMWGHSNLHWVTTSSLEAALNHDPKNPQYKALRHFLRIQFSEDTHGQARSNPDFLKAIEAFASNQPEKSLEQVNIALEQTPDNPVMKAFKAYLEEYEIKPDFDF
jgi:hypothetical protein